VICAHCGEREAIVFIRRSGEGGEGCDMALCESCAKGRGISARKGGLELNIDDLISAGLDGTGALGKPASCPVCGLELGALKREGRLGCSACADAFYDEIAGTRKRWPDEAQAGGWGEGSPAAPAAAGPDPRAIRLELESALASEDYERAAGLRDELSRLAGEPPGQAGTAPFAGQDFPFGPSGPAGASGPEDDVVLATSAWVYRDIAGLPFPGSPRGPSAPSRAALLARLLSFGAWRARSMAELGPAGRRSISERGIAPRGYAADDGSVVAFNASAGAYALLDEGDHLRVRGLRPGLDAAAALAPALDLAGRLGLDFDFARKGGIGWICSRLSDCGLGLSLSATIHIPAIVAAGMRDRLFMALLADGIVIRGFYSAGEESAGSVYELGIERPVARSAMELDSAFSAAAATVVAAERLARSEISEKGRDALVDAEGRAFGIVRHCRLMGAEEAASLLSVLRLAALRGSLAGADHRELGIMLPALGPGSVALASGLRELGSPSSLDACRAGLVKHALERAEYRVEEGA
jgi:protein-arginine kinase/protein-arginine kinase activator protein McsA